MNGMNRIFLMGHLGSDPNIYEAVNGRKYTCLNIATHRNIKNQEGDYEKRTDWHNVNVWGKNGENCAHRLSKGSGVMVEGYLSQYTREKEDGQKEYKTAITAMKVDFLPRSNSSPSDG